MLTWPAFFPQPQIAGNSRAPEDLSIRSATETGPNLARQRSAFPLEKCLVTFVMAHEWLAVFDSYWHHKLNLGATWFSIELAGETGTEASVVRFVGGYKASLVGGGHWNVSAELEIDNTPRLTLAQYWAENPP